MNEFDKIPRQSPAINWHQAIKAKYPDRPVSLRTVFYWIKKGTAPEWALKLRGEK